jgi:hypothetical protein
MGYLRTTLSVYLYFEPIQNGIYVFEWGYLSKLKQYDTKKITPQKINCGLFLHNYAVVNKDQR